MSILLHYARSSFDTKGYKFTAVHENEILVSKN
jgi:hypothetical protein